MSFDSAEMYLRGTMNETVSRRHPNRLDRMRALLAALGDPHLRYPTVHVGGTSGKGSTATMIAAALTASGKHCGLHTKPHVSSVTERVRIDGVPIARDHFADVLASMQPALEAVTAEHGRPSYYETLLALAFVAFDEARVDVAVIEVGIGGKLDGTNLVQPLVSVITNVGLDHVEVLGDTVELIAADKVGIAKRGVPLVSDARDAGARAVIERGCADAGAPFIAVGESASVYALEGERYGQSFRVETQRASYELSLPILGSFQRHNAATAIVALEQLPDDLRPPVEAVQHGFSQLVLPGRMEFFPSHPAVVFDIAHNGDKAASLARALAETFPDRRFTFVVAISETKDVPGVIAPLAQLPATFIFTEFKADGRTPIRPQRLASEAEALGAWGRAILDPVDAFAVARRNTEADGVVVVTGSTFLVAELRDWWCTNVASTTRS